MYNVEYTADDPDIWRVHYVFAGLLNLRDLCFLQHKRVGEETLDICFSAEHFVYF